MARLEITRHLHAFFPQLPEREVELEAGTVAEAVGALERLAPGIGFYLCDERGALRRHVNVFVDEHMVRDRKRLSDPLGPASRVFIVQSLSGG